MKRFLSFAGFAAVTLMALIACNEDTLMSEERAERTYEIVVKAEAQPTCAEEVLIIETLANNNVDVEKMLVTTDNVAVLASTIGEELESVETAMMIGFMLQGREASEERYAARVELGGYGGK